MKRLLNTPSLTKVFLFSVGTFAILTIAIGVGAHIRTALLVRTASSALSSGISAELATVKAEGETVSVIPELKSAVRIEDAPATFKVLTAQKVPDNLRFAVANKRGIIFSRTLTTLGKGDNGFVIGTLGRVLAETGSPTLSIERSGIDPSQLVLSSAHFIFDGNTKIGALFASFFINDAYAQQFATLYLPKGNHVLFYTHELGINGESITDPQTKKMAERFFYPQSDWLQGTRTQGIIRFEDGRYFAVINKIFPGLEHSPGGVIVLVPVHTYLHLVQGVATVLTILLFLYLLMHHHRHERKSDRVYRSHLAILGGVLLACIVLGTDLLPFPGTLTVHRAAPILYNSVLQLSPQSKVFDSSYPLAVGVTLTTGPETINTIGIALSYDPSLVEVTEISPIGSFCTHLVNTEIDATAGEIHFSCVTTNGFSGTGKIATLIMQAKKQGQFGLRFMDDTQVLANDGLGTNVLRLALPGSYTASDSSASDISLYSPTHPNAERWYANRTIDFSWNAEGATAYEYTLDTTSSGSNALPLGIAAHKISVTAPDDGVFYFHLRPEGSDQSTWTSSYRVQIDTEPPSEVQIRASAESIPVGQQVRLELSGADSLSGIQKNYYLSIDGGLYFPVHQSVYVPFDTTGVKVLSVRAYDNAGNMTERHMSITVTGTILQKIGSFITKLTGSGL